MTEREFAIDVVRRLREAGFIAYFAGGCVRDEVLGLTPADFDIATNARPEQVCPLFRRTIEVGAAFGVVEVLGPNQHKVQIATFRSDGLYTDGRRPDSVVYSTPEEDAQRRDFTINGMFFDPVENRLIDFVGGQEDLRRRVLRAIGNPVDRITEDKLRMLRAARMATRFDLSMDPTTEAAIRAMAREVTVVSAERIAEEFRKMLEHPRRTAALRLLDDLQLLIVILPEVDEMKGLPQGLPAAPTGDLWDHVLKVMERLEGPTWPEPAPISFPLAFATLLHDVGKRRTAGRLAERYTFHGHEHVGRKMASDIARRLKLSNEERVRIEWLVDKHQYLCDAQVMRSSRLKRILVHPGIGELLALHRADSLATGRPINHVEFCERILRETPPEELNPAPLVTGDDLTALGFPPGPRFKTILDSLRDAQLEGALVTREEAIDYVLRLNAEL